MIDKLKLGERPEFDPALDGVSPIKVVLGLLGLVKDPLTHDAGRARAGMPITIGSPSTPVEKSRVIVIDFLSEDPELAARVANAIADAYLVRQREAKQEQAQERRRNGCPAKSKSMRKKVADAEAKVEDFRAKSNLLVGTNNTTLSAQQLGDVNTQLAAARAQKSDAEAKAKLIRDMLQLRRADRILRHSQFRADPPACPSSASRCARSLPSNPRRCSTTIRASRN